MGARSAPLLHREDPDKDPLVGHTKVTRADWMNLARDVLVNEGAGEVKILRLSQGLGVSRSSFYGYFASRAELLAGLLAEWEARNTAQVIAHCAMPAASITQALCQFFLCFVDPAKFDRGLDFAVRDWARRDGSVRAQVDAADAARLDAVQQMFVWQGYDLRDADARARILYYMQLGYHALEVRETLETRLGRVEAYITGFSGRDADARVVADFAAKVRAIGAAPDAP